jgi:hypothetical protein
MTSQYGGTIPRLDELVAGQVLGDLSTEEQSELMQYPAKDVGDRVEKAELAAARVWLTVEESLGRISEPIPAALRSKINVTLRDAKPQSVLSSSKERGTLGSRELIAWCAALAASLMAVFAWLPRTLVDRSDQVSLVDMRRSLLAKATDVIKADWTSPSDGKGLGGDVVWSDELQEGYMRFQDLAPNDPTIEQYQLWIIDPSRDSKPVDGGVFDITSRGEQIVKIGSRLKIAKPQAFAITIEKPGGVVVSDQSRLPLLAKVAASP